MLTLPIDKLAPVSLVRSDRWLRHLLAGLDEPNATVNNQAELAKMALLDIQHCADFPLRSNDAKRAVSLWSERSLGKSHSDDFSAKSVLFALAKEYLAWEGNRFEVKPGKLIDWQRLITKVDPTWLVAAALIQRMRDGLIRDEQIMHLPNQDPQGFPLLWNDRPVADNHVHLGGHGGHSLSMLSFCLELSKKPNYTDWPYHPDFPLINRHEPQNMGEKSMVDTPHPSWNEFACLGNLLVQQLLTHTSSSHCATQNNTLRSVNSFKIRWQHPEEWKPKSLSHAVAAEVYSTSNGPFDSGIFAKHDPMQKRWLSLCLRLLQKDDQQQKRYVQNQGCRFTALLNIFIHWSNIQRSAMIVMGVGLTQFVEFFNVSARKKPTLDGVTHKMLSTQTDTQKSIQREFKVTSDAMTECKRGSYSLRSLTQSLSNYYDIEDVQLAMHFIRSGASAIQKRRSLKGELRNMQRLLNSPALNGFGLPATSYAPIKALRGLDVAADENDLRIEVFAPALRVLRESGMNRNATHAPREKLHFSIHAGEDYSHLLSGIRHIDETVRFCHYQPWDRIGHGLALGVDVEHWAHQQQVAYLPTKELLDNIVWAHHYAVEVIQLVPQLAPTLPILERQIQMLSKSVYGNDYSVVTLFRAWQLRRNCPSKHGHDPKLNNESWFPDYEASERLWCPDSVSHNRDKEAFKLWRRDVTPPMEERRNPIATVKLVPSQQRSVWDARECNQDNGLVFQLTQIELDLYEAIQDWLIQDYSRMELIFEACPTSNITIGRFQHYHEHPVYRWFPIKHAWLDEKYNRWGLRSGPLKVCVNTDDAGIMPTNIHTEHRLLRDTAKAFYQATAEDADAWINRLREIGVEAFNR